MCYKSRKAAYSTEKQERINTCLGIDSTEYEQKLQEPVKKHSAVCACETVIKFTGKNDETNKEKWQKHVRVCDFYDECEAPFLDLDLSFFGER
jgi:predicted RecB family nuclease